jgi:DNA polymerase-3 subunit beta
MGTMKFKIPSNALAAALSDVQLPAAKIGVAGTALVLLEADEKAVRITASDLDMTVSLVIEAKVEKPGTCAVHSRKLAGIAKSIPSGMVEIRTNPEKTKLGIFSGAAKATLPTMPTDEFPKQENHPVSSHFTLDSASLRSSLNRVHYAAAKDGTRYICMGVCLKAGEGKAKFAATDTKRVSVSEVAIEESASFSIVIPSRSVDRLLKILPQGKGNVRVSSGGGMAVFQWAEGRLESKLIEGEFPNYEALLVQMSERTPTTVSREKLLDAVRRADGVGLGEKVVSLHFRAATLADRGALGEAQGAVVVSVPENTDGSYSEIVPLEFAPQQESRVSFLSDYLIDPLAAGGVKDVLFRHGAETDISFIEIGNEILSIVAPVKTSR